MRQSRCSVEETEIDRESAPSVRVEVPIIAMDAQERTDNVDSRVQSGAEATSHVRRDVQQIESDTQSVVSCQNFGDLDDSHDQRLRRVRQRVKRTDVAAVIEVFLPTKKSRE